MSLYASNRASGGGSGGAVTSIGPFGTTPNAAGGDIALGVLTLEPASGSFPGGVSTTTQSFAGAKTFLSALIDSVSVSSPLFLVTGSSSGTITVQGQAAAGTYNFNLPTTAGSSGDYLTSGGGSGSAMTWTTPPTPLVLGNLTSTPTTNLVVTGGTGAVIGSGALLTLTGASLVEATSSVLTITGAANAVLGTGVSIQVKLAATAQSGYLSSTDWNTFNGKQAAGNYLTALTGEGTASGPGSAALTLSNAAVIAKVLTGYVSGAGTISAADTILGAIQKLNGNIAAVPGTVTSVGLSVPGTSLFGTTGTPVTSSGTLGLTTTGTSGGIPFFNSTSTLNTSALLAANQIVLGGGAATAPATLGSLGTTTTVLHGNAAGAPTFGAVVLTTDVSGILPIANGGTAVASVTTAPTASAFAGWDANSNLSANNHIDGFTTTATAAGTTTMTIASTATQVWTGSTTQTVKLPTTSVVAGAKYVIINNSSGIVTVQSSGANTIQAMAGSTQATFVAVATTPTTAANWTVVGYNAAVGTQTAGTFYAGPTSGSAATPTFRALQVPTRQIFTSGSGNYTTPAGVLYIRATVISGGGGGAGSPNTSGIAGAGGGGGGGTSIYYVTPTASQVFAYVVGAGGAAGGVGANGTIGGTSSFNATASCTGGGPGTTGGVSANTPGIGGAGGVGSGGTINFIGNDGGSGSCGTAGVLQGSGGAGGGSFMGGGGTGGQNSSVPTGRAGNIYGGGGGGGVQNNAGSAGAAGVVIVEEFYQ